jgi:hypothetical protein
MKIKSLKPDGISLLQAVIIADAAQLRFRPITLEMPRVSLLSII